jgi:hypothetical protein
MTDLDVVISMLETQKDVLESHGRRLDKMETLLSKMDVLANMISNTQLQVDALWRKFDDTCGPDGLLTRIRDHQAQCPKAQITRLWWAVGLLAMVYATTLTVVVSVASKGG